MGNTQISWRASVLTRRYARHPIDMLTNLSVFVITRQYACYPVGIPLIRQYAHRLASLFLGSTGYWGDNTKGALVVKIGFKPDGLSYIDRGLKAQRIF